jgi:hypothetical protein
MMSSGSVGRTTGVPVSSSFPSSTGVVGLCPESGDVLVFVGVGFVVSVGVGVLDVGADDVGVGCGVALVADADGDALRVRFGFWLLLGEGSVALVRLGLGDDPISEITVVVISLVRGSLSLKMPNVLS